MLLSLEFSVTVVASTHLHNGCIGALEQSFIKCIKL